MVIYIVAVGRLRNHAMREICDDFSARIRRRYRLEVREVPESGGKKRRPRDVRASEAQALLAAAPDSARRMGLSRLGANLTSVGLSERLAEWQRGARDVVLLLGGAHGLDEQLLAGCESTVSLSHLTLPHEIARLLLLEQLYRAGTILHGDPYHKGTLDPQ